MAATTIQSFPSSDVKMRFAETYVSEGLNAKLAGVIPRGIYRGFALAPSLAPLTAQLDSDSLGRHLAVYESLLGFSLTLRRSGGTISVPLTAFANSTVYVVLFAEYTISSATVAELRVYSVADYNAAPEKNELIVLGVVAVPGAGVIPASAVSVAESTLPWKQVAGAASRSWHQIIKNGSFDESDGNAIPGFLQTIPGFTGEVTGAATVAVNGTNPRSGTSALEIAIPNVASTAKIGPGQYSSLNPLDGGVVPVRAGQDIDVSLWLSGVTVGAYTNGTNGLRLIVTFYDAADVLQSTAQVASSAAIHVGTFSYAQLVGTFTAPVAGYFVWHLEAAVDLGVGPSTFYVADLRMFLQPQASVVDDEGAAIGEVSLPVLRGMGLDLVPTGALSRIAQSAVARVTSVISPALDLVLSLSKAGNKQTINVPRWDTPYILKVVDQDFGPNAFGISGTDSTADQDTIPHTYKLLHAYRLSQSSNVRARVYAKTAPALEKGMVFTVNARWGGGGDQFWNADDTTEKASKTAYQNTGVDMRGKFVTAVPWSDAAWSTSPYMESLRLGGVLYLEEYVRNEGSYQYDTVREVTYVVPVSDFNLVSSNGSYIAASAPATEAHWNNQLGTCTWVVALVIPPGCAILEVKLLIDQAGTGVTATLHKWDTNYYIPVPPVPVVSLLASAAGVGLGRQILSLLPGAPAYAYGSTQFECRVGGSFFSNTSKLLGALVRLEVGGPSDI
jgi:hypothetical protein